MIPSPAATEWVGGEVDTVEPDGEMGDEEPSECRRNRGWIDRDWLVDMMGLRRRVVRRLVGAAERHGLGSTLLEVDRSWEVGLELATFTNIPDLRLPICEDDVFWCILWIACCNVESGLTVVRLIGCIIL